MRKTIFALVCGSTLLASPLALAGGTQSAASQVKIEPSAAPPAKPALICRAPIDNGMLLPRAKQCYTKVEWEAREKRMQKSVSDFELRNMQTFHP